VNRPGKLYLLPVPISDAPARETIPDFNFSIVSQLKYFIAEDAKTARKWLKAFHYPAIAGAEILILNEHTAGSEHVQLLSPLLNGHDVGLMSDAGCPGIADPGAGIVKLAHARQIAVLPLVGPSAIVLSIMASGFNGQNFAFVGYLPIEKPQRIKRVKELESLAQRQGQAQFFIETPYRNAQLAQALLESLAPSTRLFIGVNLAAPGQVLRSLTVSEWKKNGLPEMNKVPVVYGIYQ
jgi:16S rRNA (cytidine1402-2'-O)-methyltransferase